MIICRALLATGIVLATIPYAGAQFGGMPGMPGSGGGMPGAGFGGPPQGPPPKCAALLAIRDELQKHGQAISSANDKKADVKVACSLFRKYIATEAKMIKMLEVDGPGCGAGPQVVQQVRGSHATEYAIGIGLAAAVIIGLFAAYQLGIDAIVAAWFFG